MINKILFPSHYKCLLCGCEIHISTFEFCESCIKKLPLLSGKVCLLCGEQIYSDANYCLHCKKERPFFTKSFAVFSYENEVQQLIYDLKYKNKKFIANALSNFLLAKFLQSKIDVDVIIPVPLYYKREIKRGYNQCYYLCTSFIDRGFNVNNNCVIRCKNTISQTNLTKGERRKNMENAFKVLKNNEIKDKKILLIDDVYTTGATFNSMAKLLFSSGAKKVYGLTVAHTNLEKA